MSRQYKLWNVETVLVSLIASTIPFKINVGNSAIIASLICAIYLVFKQRNLNYIKKPLYFVFPLILFLISVVSAFTSNDVITGFKKLDNLQLLVFVPLFFFIINKKKVDLQKVLSTFTVSVCLFTIVLLINNIVKLSLGHAIDTLFFLDFVSLFGHSPIHYALISLLALIFLCTNYKSKTFFYGEKGSLVMALILLTGIVFCASKTITLILMFFLIFYGIINIKQAKTRILIFFAFLIVALFSHINYTKNRVLSGLEYDLVEFKPNENILKAKQFTYNEKQNISDLEIRLIFIKIGLYHFVNDNKILFGYGLGDVQHNLDYYYMTYNLAPNWFEGYNLHNQYLDYLITYGSTGLFLFLLYIIHSIYFSIKFKNQIHTIFLLVMMIAFITEVYMVRNKGIVIFIFFNTLFLSKTNENCNNWN